jgi:hypothetical protein
MTIHAPQSLARNARRLDCRLASVSRITCQEN